ncbi:MAG: hypothetical protein COV75_07310 [Candidatus Omnitrophica bacterium CG11_big_fil_rev_8_21_14_0_20_63_9]|nr:MAG: hypothetical protein COV75_07310 [Candidatus Omnitrophica bacterium CG11_big_fil_rev_8_21_14_0_20_63_9]
MNKGVRGLLVAVAIASVGVMAGCAKQAASSSEAIQHAKTLKAPEQQTDYLVSQAQAFMNSKDYQEAIKTAQYVLSSVDVRSQAATDLLGQAKAKLATDAQAVIGNTKKQKGL